MKVVCVGDCGIDHYLPSGLQQFGGITANFARQARAEFPADDEIHIVSCVGDDEGAALVHKSLGASDIDCHIAALRGATPVQYIELEPDGEKNFVRYDAGVLNDFVFSDQQREIIAASTLMVAPVFVQIIDLFRKLLSIEISGTVAIDFADFLQHPDFELLEEHLDRIHIGFFGLTIDDSAAIDRIASLAAQHNRLFVVTLGPHGSIAFKGTKHTRCDAVQVENVVDTTGAGDAFAASFLSRYCHGASVSESMQRGAEAAALVVAKLGSLPE